MIISPISYENSPIERRKRNFYSIFGIVSAMLSLGHFVGTLPLR
jgi:hypothetical protein